jgi:hypothetical protein
MRRAVRSLLLAAALLAPVLPGTATAAPLLVVSGTGATTADFTLDTAVTFDYSDAVITGSGRYGGFALYSASGRDYGGVVALPDLSDPQRPMTADAPTVFGGRTRLPPGRYRVYLIADKDTVVRLRLLAGDGVDVRTAKPYRGTYAVSRHTVRAGETAGALRLPIAVNARTKSYLLARYSGGTADNTVRVCLARRGARCARDDGSVTNTGPAFGTTQSGLGLPAWSVPRSRDVRAEVSVAPVPVSVTPDAVLGLAVIQIDLTT